MTDAKKLEIIAYIVDTNYRNREADDGDRHLSDDGNAMEAISAILDGDEGNAMLRMFLGSQEPAGAQEPPSL